MNRTSPASASPFIQQPTDPSSATIENCPLIDSFEPVRSLPTNRGQGHSLPVQKTHNSFLCFLDDCWSFCVFSANKLYSFMFCAKKTFPVQFPNNLKKAFGDVFESLQILLHGIHHFKVHKDTNIPIENMVLWKESLREYFLKKINPSLHIPQNTSICSQVNRHEKTISIHFSEDKKNTIQSNFFFIHLLRFNQVDFVFQNIPQKIDDDFRDFAITIKMHPKNTCCPDYTFYPYRTLEENYQQLDVKVYAEKYLKLLNTINEILNPGADTDKEFIYNNDWSFVENQFLNSEALKEIIFLFIIAPFSSYMCSGNSSLSHKIEESRTLELNNFLGVDIKGSTQLNYTIQRDKLRLELTQPAVFKIKNDAISNSKLKALLKEYRLFFNGEFSFNRIELRLNPLLLKNDHQFELYIQHDGCVPNEKSLYRAAGIKLSGSLQDLENINIEINLIKNKSSWLYWLFPSRQSICTRLAGFF